MVFTVVFLYSTFLENFSGIRKILYIHIFVKTPFSERNICKTVLWFSYVRALSNTSFQMKYSNSKILPYKPHVTHQFEENNHVSASTSSQELQICGFLYDPARVVGMFFKIWKYFTTLPTSLPNNSQPPNFGISSILPPTSSYYHPLPPNLRILSRYFSHLINVFNTIMIYTTCLFYK